MHEVRLRFQGESLCLARNQIAASRSQPGNPQQWKQETPNQAEGTRWNLDETDRLMCVSQEAVLAMRR